ncbi:hypothetical protein SEVIR_5G107700v4 [Setaria viridis]|uniref:KIB1-4 beta-propeller domain-containing protein n=1 Tax=Setaria viridis TaxID=4556 RepID=A0A4U6UC61_SETVI|nr:hypothetical protein SEVIR_5G107700v2 [Setaria viridis]
MDPKATGDLTSLAASFPLVVYDHGEQPDNSHTMLSVVDGSSHTCRIPELQNSTCLETPCGLVLVADNTTPSQCSLWNPQTGEKISLPALDAAPPENSRCLLSDTVSSPDCLVLINDTTGFSFMFCHVRGGTAWTTQPYDIGLYALPPGSLSAPAKMEIDNLAAVQGKFYFMENLDEVWVLSFAQDPEPHLEMTSFDALMPTFVSVSDEPQLVIDTYLLESSQELFLVCVYMPGCDFEHIEEVSAYKMDFSKQEWCKVTDIGDRAFLLGPRSFAASCAAGEHGLKRGCVYYAFDFFRDTNEFYIFDLMEGTREVTGPGQDVPLSARQPFWMVPVCP